MLRTIKRIIKGEAGQALPIVLALLIIGGLTIVPSLALTYASAKNSQMLESGIRGGYAAEAGVEQALWSLANGTPPSAHLSQKVNNMSVDIQTIDKGPYTLYFGELIEAGEHSDYLGVSGNISWDAGADAYKYTVNITWQADPGSPPIRLLEMGARIPLDYSYLAGSAADFTGNLSTDEPDETLDGQGAYMLNWELSPPYPEISENQTVRTQCFHITGAGDLEGHYPWVVANREDIGAVGEINGNAYQIISTAISSETGKTAARIEAEVIIGGGVTNIISWHIDN